MILLAFETTHAVASVAVYRDGEVFEKEIRSDLRHEQTVMPAVDELMDSLGIEPSQLDAVASDIGPGSFTGIRIGVCHANAVADVFSIPSLGFTSLDILAYTYVRSCRSSVAALVDAAGGKCYGALYNSAGERIGEMQASETEAFLSSLPEGTALTGTGFAGCDGAVPHAADVARLAALKLQTGADPELRAMPCYLRASQAERNRKA